METVRTPIAPEPDPIFPIDPPDCEYSEPPRPPVGQPLREWVRAYYETLSAEDTRCIAEWAQWRDDIVAIRVAEEGARR